MSRFIVRLNNVILKKKKKGKEKETYMSIKDVASDIIPAVQIISSEMLAASGSLKRRHPSLSVEGVPLQPSNKRHCIFAGDHRIFSRCFLASSPPWVPKYVYIWCPKCHPVRLPCIVYCSCFCSYGLRITIPISIILFVYF